MVLRGQVVDPALQRFMRKVRVHVLYQQRADEVTLDAWVRVVAGARLAEGFDGAYADWLHRVADGAIRLHAGLSPAPQHAPSSP
jgi:hypothetical protein